MLKGQTFRIKRSGILCHRVPSNRVKLCGFRAPVRAVLQLPSSHDPKAAASGLILDTVETLQNSKHETKDAANTQSTQEANLADVKAEQLDRTIANLQKLNAELQAEMQQVVSGLTGVMKTMSKATAQSPLPTSSPNGSASTSAAAASDSTITRQVDIDAPASKVHNGTHASKSELSHFASSCVVQHPGALCCTNIAAKTDPISGTCTVTIKTTAKHTDDLDHAGNALSPDDMSALAAQALLAAATDHFRSRTQVIHSHTHPSQRLAQHNELCRILNTGTVLNAAYNTPSQFGHPSFILQLRDEQTGRRLKAVFKPRVENDACGWHRAPMEYVAYKLNLLLGMDLVPPVAYRRTPLKLTVDGEDFQYEEGAMMLFVEEANTLNEFDDSVWGVSKDVLLADTRILDVLLHNSDRHHGHFLLGRHWCRGSWAGERWVGEKRPVLIDHAASFRKDAHVSMEHENAFQTGPVQCVSAHTYLRLRFLDAAALSQEFAAFLSDEEIVALVQRRNYVLRYLDKLVDQQGYQSVVRDNVSS